MNTKNKIIKIVKSILTVIIFLPPLLVAIFNFLSYANPIPVVIIAIIAILYYLIMIKNDFFKDSKRSTKIIFCILLLVISSLSIYLPYMMLIEVMGDGKIMEDLWKYLTGDLKNLIQIAFVLDIFVLPYFLTFMFCFGVNLIINSFNSKNRAIKWYNYLIITVASFIISIVLLYSFYMPVSHFTAFPVTDEETIRDLNERLDSYHKYLESLDSSNDILKSE